MQPGGEIIVGPKSLAVTEQLRAEALARSTSSGSMSTPIPRALYLVAAVSTIRPSPEPRSTTKSFGPTFATSSIAFTTDCGVGTYGPPVRSTSAASERDAASASAGKARAFGNFIGAILA